MYEMIGWHFYDLADQHHKDLLLNARRVRLARQALTGRARQHHFYGRALAWLGHRLVVWGGHLQERHGSVTTNHAPG